MQNSKDKIIKLIEKYGRKVEKSVRLCNVESTHSNSYSCIGKCHYTQLNTDPRNSIVQFIHSLLVQQCTKCE